ncbi:MAG: undecaprenyl-diphosphate phosphatase [Lachnospiraceae bacterium]|nr:undecaprenyl-diphosphate phosphatase [Lachnospiraceae bacterium]
MLNVLKAILYGVVEGITEWLPISSTGHMILLHEFIKLGISEDFWDVFLVVIQLGAVMAVLVVFWQRLWPFGLKRNRKKRRSEITVKPAIIGLWVLIIIACLPAAVIGVLFDDVFDRLFYNGVCVALALIVFGLAFIAIENRNKGMKPRIYYLEEIDLRTALFIGGCQLLAAIFPGTSRSGATILGALFLGVERSVATEFSFFLSVPVMFGASLLKIIKYIAGDSQLTGAEVSLLAVGMIVAFAVSLLVIRFFLSYIRKHDFRVFGWYRIALGLLMLLIFGIRGIIAWINS